MRPLHERARCLLDGTNLRCAATVYRSGAARLWPTWVGPGDDDVLLNSRHSRGCSDRVRKNSPVALSFKGSDEPTNFPETVGRVVEETMDRAREHIDVLSHRDHGIDYRSGFKGGERVPFRIEPEVVNYVNPRERVPGIPDPAQLGAGTR
jgi:hypothetical protein